jgi:hypothetical protein
MDRTQRKIGIIDSNTGGIIFVSRDEGYKNLRTSAKRPAADIIAKAGNTEIEVKKKSCPCKPG